MLRHEVWNTPYTYYTLNKLLIYLKIFIKSRYGKDDAVTVKLHTTEAQRCNFKDSIVHSEGVVSNDTINNRSYAESLHASPHLHNYGTRSLRYCGYASRV